MTADDFERLLLDELPRLRSFLRRLAGRGDLAEDLLQDVIVRALRYRDSFDGTRSLTAWLGRTAFRVYLDHRDRGAREQRLPAAPPPHRDGVGGELEACEEVDLLLAALTPIERQVLLAFHRDGLSLNEIAARLAMPVNTVKSHLHRAREKLLDARPGGREP